MQVEAGIVRVALEIGRRGHVVAEESGERAELRPPRHVPGDAVGGRVPLHEAHHRRLLRPLGRRQDRLGLGGGRSGRLLDEDGQAAGQRQRRQRRVDGGADGDADRVQAGMGKQVPGLGIRGRRRSQQAAALERAGVGIGDRGHFTSEASQLRQKHRRGMAAKPDPADLQSIFQAHRGSLPGLKSAVERVLSPAVTVLSPIGANPG